MLPKFGATQVPAIDAGDGRRIRIVPVGKVTPFGSLKVMTKLTSIMDGQIYLVLRCIVWEYKGNVKLLSHALTLLPISNLDVFAETSTIGVLFMGYLCPIQHRHDVVFHCASRAPTVD
jgi:hypothetical protein